MLQKARKYIVGVFQALGSLVGSPSSAALDPRRVVRPWREDSLRTYPSVGITPSKVLSFLQAADAGWPQMQFELFGEMLQKWPRLAAVEATRRLALTGLDWEITPATAGGESSTKGDGERAAEFCRKTLESIERFRDALDHMANGIGFGIAVSELVWEDGRLIDIVPVPHSRLVGDPNEPWRLRVRTEENASVGVALDEQPFKWVVHSPHSAPGRSFDGGLLRASALLYLAQNLSFKDWLIFSQIAGMPARVARFEPGTPEADKQQLLKMLESLGTDAVGIFSKNIELQFIESGRKGRDPYQPLQEHCNKEITILWLGQHLTTDLASSGSLAAAEVHDRVREDLLVNDIANEGQTLRRDVLTPIVRARFGDGVPVPQFRRSLIQAVDTKVLADTLAVAVERLGLSVPKRWVHRALGIPEPAPQEPVLTGKVE